MAVFAYRCRLHMRWVLACGIAAVVAARTISGDIDVVKVCRDPAACGMAIVTIVATDDVVRIFARCDCAVMAGSATTNNLQMIDVESRRKAIRCMAILTYARREDMRLILASRRAAIVAGHTVADDIGVIEHRR